MRTTFPRLLLAALAATTLAACQNDTMEPPQAKNPDSAPRAMVDRFSDAAAHLFMRSANPALPAAGAAIDFDQAPFITQGLGPSGQPVRYYNFDVMPTAPVHIWVLFAEGSSTPVANQLNIIDAIPGDPGYSDFWQVVKVTVPADYVANTATSLQDLVDAGYTMQITDMIVNCPVVPEGSTASEGPGATGLTRGWYKDQVVFYFDFNEASLTATAQAAVPTSDIFVAFNVNPDQTGGGAASGFKAQGSSVQTHNVVETLPGDPAYSPLWDVMPYDNAAFGMVHDLASAQAADNFGLAAVVNCPIVFVGMEPADPATAMRAMIDRFSNDAGHLFLRSANATLPAPNAAIDFDSGPFITRGLGPTGNSVRYYNFDVMPEAPAPIFVLFYASGDPVPGQHNIVDVIPGDAGYNDFWQVVKVTVPDEYIANSMTRVQELVTAGYPQETTNMLVNCPIVPEGSTAMLRLNGGDTGLTMGWYKGQLVFYFNFFEAPIQATQGGMVPGSPIFVAFNINPDQPGGGPASGFMTEAGTDQTHNVVATLPGDADYSPFWDVFPYDNASFGQVTNLSSAQAAPNFGEVANVNCPIVDIG
jgi:hypothetical protein